MIDDSMLIINIKIQSSGDISLNCWKSQSSQEFEGY